MTIQILHTIKRRFVLVLLLYVTTLVLKASPADQQFNDTTWHSTKEEALRYLDSISQLDTSSYWPNVAPDLFLQNLKAFVFAPLKFYEGRSTNFCAYSALSYIPFYYYPLEFCRFMVTLYKTGEAKMGKAFFSPGPEIRTEVGLLKYKGPLDINPMGQMWLLSLADHFKGYVNFFNRKFDKGDENTLWASANLHKLKRMLQQLFPFPVHSRGFELWRPCIKNVYGFLREKLNSGVVFLHLNFRSLYTVDNVKFRLRIPTHFVHLLDIQKKDDGIIDIYYSSDGEKTLQQITPALLKKIVFGIAWCVISEK